MPPSEDDFDVLTVLLGRLERLNEAVVAEVCTRHGVSTTEVRVLAVLRHAADGQGIRPTDIGRWVVQTSGGLATTLGRLEARDLLTRVADPDDGRARLVALTDAGRLLHDAAFADLVDRYSAMFRHVDVPAATSVVRSLIDALERTSGLAPSAGWTIERAGAPLRS